MRRLTPTRIGLIIAGILILAFALWTFASTRRGNPDKLTADNKSVVARPADPANRCASQATYDQIKRDLFRRAAALRGSDQAAFDKIAAYSVVRIDRPLLDSEDDATGAVACSGALILDLPPGVAVVGGRRTLTSDIGYALQRSADGNGEVLTLTRAEGIITPLATLARVGRSADPPAPAQGDPLAPNEADSPAQAEYDREARTQIDRPPPIQVDRRPPAEVDRRPPTATSRSTEPANPQRRAQATSKPSFNCANARTRGERAVCGDSGLAALDRQMAAQYHAAVRFADPGTRAQLQRSRNNFLGYRDRCPSNDCIADTYRGRMREIRDIADGR